MDTPETARYLNVPEQTLHHWAHRNVGPPYSKIGKYRRYRRTDVDAWLEAQKRGGAAA